MATPDMSQFSVDPTGYQVDTTSDQAQYMRGFAYRLGQGINGNESYKDWLTRNQGYLDRLYEQDTLAMQRQYEMYMDSTRYQRLVQDLKAAGLNPWLALNGGSASAGSVSIAGQSGSSNKLSSKFDNNDGNKNLSQVAKLLTSALSSAMMVALMMG